MFSLSFVASLGCSWFEVAWKVGCCLHYLRWKGWFVRIWRWIEKRVTARVNDELRMSRLSVVGSLLCVW